MNELKQKRDALLHATRDLALKVKAEARAFTDDERAQVEANLNEADALLKTLELTRDIEAAATPAPAAPLLADGGTQKRKLNTLRGIDGRMHAVFTRDDKLADHVNHVQDGMSIRDLGNALAAMAAGESHRFRDEIRALSEGTNTAGGLMVSEELSAQIIDQMRAASVCISAGAQVVPMSSDTLRFVRIATDPTVAEYAEGGTISETDGSFDSILLTCKKLACLTSATNELLEDAANAGDAIVTSITQAMARATDDYILNRLFESTQIGTESGVGAIAYADLLKARYDVRALNGNPATLVCNPSLPYDLSLLTETSTGAFMAPPAQLADLQILESTAIADSHAVVGDFTKLIVGIRRNVELRLSSEAGSALAKDITYFRCTTRMDAGILRPSFRILAGIS